MVELLKTFKVRQNVVCIKTDVNLWEGVVMLCLDAKLARGVGSRIT